VALLAPRSWLALAALGLSLAVAAPALAGAPVNVLVLKEHGVGSPAHAQGYVDRLVASVAQQQGWESATGKYLTRRAAAAGWIGANAPQFAILSLAAFLDMRGKYDLAVIGKAEVATAGGREYHVISASAQSLDECKGGKLATDHADDPRFIDKVVAGGDFTLSDFQVVETNRPMQTIKAVTSGEATCALVDDAQFESRSKTEGGGELASVWRSKRLPPMVVVAFPSAPAARKRAFAAGLGVVCTGEGKAACEEVGIKALLPATDVEYKAVIKAWGD
jgi:hypothetical protein